MGSNPNGDMDVCCECYVLSGRGLYDELITRPEESYRLWCVVVCDLETSKMWRPWPTGGCSATGKKYIYILPVTVPTLQSMFLIQQLLVMKCFVHNWQAYSAEQITVIPRLTSDHANKFSANEDFFAVFWTRLTNVLVDVRANIK
jgi:hypothetical protein